MRLIVLGTILLISLACASAAVTPHALSDPEIAALGQLLNADWSALDVSRFRALWPSDMLVSESAGANCSGSLTLTERKTDGTRTFVFNKLPAAGRCVERLSALTFEFRVSDRHQQHEIGAQLRRRLDATQDQIIEDTRGYTAVSWPSATISQTARLSATDDGLRFTIFRADVNR